jgi:hypothetical protein
MTPRDIGKPVESFKNKHKQRKLAKKITQDQSHPVSSEFHNIMQSRRCYRIPKLKTNQFENSFIPHAI